MAFQSFKASSSPEQGPDRIAALRKVMAERDLAAFIVPRSDMFQGEYVAPCDERLSWLTGFTGSAGFCVVLQDIAGLFVDGRYRLQGREQTDKDTFQIVAWPETKIGDWITDNLEFGTVGFDPWLFTKSQIEGIENSFAGTQLELLPTDDLINAIWTGRPGRPDARAFAHPLELSGEKSGDKRLRLANSLKAKNQTAAVLTMPDSICWLLNIRGSDIPRVPVVQCCAILHDTGHVSLFADPGKFEDLGPDPAVDIFSMEEFAVQLKNINGCVRLDPQTAPIAVSHLLEKEFVEIEYDQDPCVLPKATKNTAEVAGTRAAHIRDAKAMIEFLAWLDAQTPSSLTEIDVVVALENFRKDTNALHDISFETISGAGPNGAIVHYRVTEETNRRIADRELLLVDSGGQYVDGTTDITRTVAMGMPTDFQKRCFTRVLQGMIALSRIRWPRGLAGRDLDALARAPLWMAGQDYDHGTGHGVGSFLGVHEGPQRISKVSHEPLLPGMIVSNEPGYYKEGEFGIRIENLVIVQESGESEDGDPRNMLEFETLTWVPIDRNLIDTAMMSQAELNWLNSYHAKIRELITVSADAQPWFLEATKPL